jgi:hypothetical protein
MLFTLTLCLFIHPLCLSGSRQSLFSAQSALSSSIKKAQDSFEGSEGLADMRALLQRVNEAREALPPLNE